MGRSESVVRAQTGDRGALASNPFGRDTKNRWPLILSGVYARGRSKISHTGGGGVNV